jgi:CRISPR-associated protein Csx17
MAELTLPGLRTTPLGGYLAALGLLSATTRLLDPAATGYWRGQSFVLDNRFSTAEELAAELVARFEPEPIVSPWNQGSGFAANGKSVAAERALAWGRSGDDPRLAALRTAITAGDKVMAEVRVRGWAVEKHKHDVLHLCRNTFPDRAVRWLDAAVALGPDGDLAFSRLLGTGGNLGRLDLSSTYVQRCREVFEHRHSRAWLTALLTGAPTVALPGASLGQYDPASAGNPEENSAAGNPWLFLLLIEGALLFATAVVRRHGSDHTHAALPFQVRGSAAGLDTAAAGENAMAEFWAPEWATPCALSDVEQLLGEGRAEWRNRPARSGLDFARAAATLGVDRGVDAFQRHVFAERLGQSPIAVPAGRVLVSRRDGVDALAGLDPWLDRVRRVTTAGVAAQCRAVEQALFTHARTGAAADLASVFAAVGACHETVARSGAARRDTAPLVLRQGKALLAALMPALREDPTLRVAVALAAAHDPGAATTLGGLRPHLSPVGADRGRPVWTQRPAPTALRGGFSTAVAEAARRRGFPRADGDHPDGSAAVRGARLGFWRGPALAAADLTTLATGRFDERRAADLLAGLLTVDWSPVTLARLPGGGRHDHDPAVDLLVPFTADGLVSVTDASGTRTLRLLPDATWPTLLRAGHTDRVLADAAHRIRISGLRHVIRPARSALAGPRLASLLLARTTADTRVAALAHVAVLPSRPDLTIPTSQESPA